RYSSAMPPVPSLRKIVYLPRRAPAPNGGWSCAAARDTPELSAQARKGSTEVRPTSRGSDWGPRPQARRHHSQVTQSNPSFESVTTPRPEGDGRFLIDVPDGWQQGRGAF